VLMNRREIANAIGYARPSCKAYEDIENACLAMSAMTIEFADTWYDRKQGDHRGRRGGAHLISEFNFYDERRTPELRSYVILGDLLFDSLRSGYFNGVDLAYVNALPTPLAQRLYIYLTKKDHGKLSYSEDVGTIAAKMNLKAKKLSAIRAALEPALDQLAIGASTGRRFLASWKIRDRSILDVSFFRSHEEYGRLAVRSLRQGLSGIAAGTKNYSQDRSDGR
jgi:hypothetical protein